MQKAYIIIAHKNPVQVRRLLHALNDGAATFFLHIDIKIPVADFMQAVADLPVYWVERVDAGWGEFGLTQAILNGLTAVRASGIRFDRIITLSGQDYPIKSNKEINRILAQSPYANFIEYFPLPNHEKWIPNGGMYRVNKYFFGMGPVQRLRAKSMNFLAGLLPFLRRTIPENMKPYAGSNWWIIDYYTMSYILDYININPEYVAFHRHTFVADELFFHMILLNTDDEHIRAKTLNNNLRFILWKQYAPHPEWLGMEHLDAMLQSDALFARKFDQDYDSDVLGAIDRFREEGTVAPVDHGFAPAPVMHLPLLPNQSRAV